MVESLKSPGKLRVQPGRNTQAVVFEAPKTLTLRDIELPELGAHDLLVKTEFSGISTGTEKLLWNGDMPHFPGMGYPLVPGYESIGRVTAVGRESQRHIGERVFVSGANCYGDVRGLFGGAASYLLVDETKALPLQDSIQEEGILLALTATAHHAMHIGVANGPPDLVVGHGILGRLIARMTEAMYGVSPTVWEVNPKRREGFVDYAVIDPNKDKKQYRHVIDVSGDSSILNPLIGALQKGGEIVLAGFYPEPLSFVFPPAFMKEASIRIAAQWQPEDLVRAKALIEEGALKVDDLISHRNTASNAQDAYTVALSDPDCLKMVLDWRSF